MACSTAKRKMVDSLLSVIFIFRSFFWKVLSVNIVPLHRSAADADAEAEKSANGGRQSQGDLLGDFMFEKLKRLGKFGNLDDFIWFHTILVVVGVIIPMIQFKDTWLLTHIHLLVPGISFTPWGAENFTLLRNWTSNNIPTSEMISWGLHRVLWGHLEFTIGNMQNMLKPTDLSLQHKTSLILLEHLRIYIRSWFW